MAAGDYTIDTGSPRLSGRVRVVTGTMEVDNSQVAFAVCDTKSVIVNASVMNMDGVGTARVTINDAAGTPTQGSISVDGENAGPETYTYRVEFI